MIDFSVSEIYFCYTEFKMPRRPTEEERIEMGKYYLDANRNLVEGKIREIKKLKKKLERDPGLFDLERKIKLIEEDIEYTISIEGLDDFFPSYSKKDKSRPHGQ